MDEKAVENVTSKTGPAKSQEFEGVLWAWFETGTEGLIWTVLKDSAEEDLTSYDNMLIIESGDHLIVFDTDNTELFNGVIDQDRKVGWQEYPQNPGNGQPCALGCWIHWTQRGWSPDEWAKLFLKNAPLQAKLTRHR